MHADGSVAWYGHMKAGSLTNKAVGQTVSSGEYLGIVGSSGNSTGPHLHFGIRVNGKAVCPQSLLMAIGNSKPIPDIKQLPTTGCSY